VSHCSDNAADRATGALWERKFQLMMVNQGFLVTMHQLRKSGSAIAVTRVSGNVKAFTLPDASVWDAPGFDAEIKHKDPTSQNTFGLEEYRLKSLVAFARRSGRCVQYVVHDYSRCPGGTRADRKSYPESQIEHWITADVLDLYSNRTDPRWGTSYVNGQPKRVPIHYWPTSLWVPVADFLESYARAA